MQWEWKYKNLRAFRALRSKKCWPISALDSAYASANLRAEPKLETVWANQRRIFRCWVINWAKPVKTFPAPQKFHDTLLARAIFHSHFSSYTSYQSRIPLVYALNRESPKFQCWLYWIDLNVDWCKCIKSPILLVIGGHLFSLIDAQLPGLIVGSPLGLIDRPLKFELIPEWCHRARRRFLARRRWSTWRPPSRLTRETNRIPSVC